MSKTREMGEDEQYVRDNWFAWPEALDGIKVFDHGKYPGCSFPVPEGMDDCFSHIFTWKEAASRTRELKQEIADKREEIETLQYYSSIAVPQSVSIFERILAVLESQLTELTRGLRKPEENQ